MTMMESINKDDKEIEELDVQVTDEPDTDDPDTDFDMDW